MTQFSLFGAAVAEPTLDDLDGVLLGGGHWARSAAGARLSVVVADRWRADALAALRRSAACGGRDARRGRGRLRGADGVPCRSHQRGGPVDTRCERGPPAGFALTPGGLRLWAIAAGHPDDVGYLLGTAEPDDALHLAGGRAAGPAGRGRGVDFRAWRARLAGHLAQADPSPGRTAGRAALRCWRDLAANALSGRFNMVGYRPRRR